MDSINFPYNKKITIDKIVIINNPEGKKSEVKLSVNKIAVRPQRIPSITKNKKNPFCTYLLWQINIKMIITIVLPVHRKREYKPDIVKNPIHPNISGAFLPSSVNWKINAVTAEHIKHTVSYITIDIRTVNILFLESKNLEFFIYKMIKENGASFLVISHFLNISNKTFNSIFIFRVLVG